MLRALAGLRARWPAARAALIGLAIALGLLEGCPFQDRDRMRPGLRPVLLPLDDVRLALLGPFDWISDDLHFTQRWALFRGASRKRFRLYIEGRTATGDWVLLYRAGDPDYTEYTDLLEYRRIRGTYNPGGTYVRSQYHGFGTWICLRVLDDHPDFTFARIRMERIVIGEGEFTATGEFTHEHQEPRRRK